MALTERAFFYAVAHEDFNEEVVAYAKTKSDKFEAEQAGKLAEQAQLRSDITDALTAQGEAPMTAKELATIVGVSPQRMSYYLVGMHTDGLVVRVRKTEKSPYEYSLA